MTNPSLDLAFEWLQNSEKKCDTDQLKWNEIRNQTKKGLLIKFFALMQLYLATTFHYVTYFVWINYETTYWLNF